MINWSYRSLFRVQDEKKGRFKWFLPWITLVTLPHRKWTLPTWHQDIWLEVLLPVLMMMQSFQEITLCKSCYIHTRHKSSQKNKWFWTAYTLKMETASSQNENNDLLTDMVSYPGRLESWCINKLKYWKYLLLHRPLLPVQFVQCWLHYR